ncbi:MAG: hypothetical protein FJ267_09475, partial [Planctomycetes bacterium]|nr:hypothetical protein [Planctomycetota bacterium]
MLTGHDDLGERVKKCAATGILTAVTVISWNLPVQAQTKWLKPTQKKTKANVQQAVAVEEVTQRDNIRSPGGQIQQVAGIEPEAPVATAQSNEVMKQLELLYQKDGREMPDMKMMQMTPTGPQPSSGPSQPQQTNTANPPAASTPAGGYASGNQQLQPSFPAGNNGVQPQYQPSTMPVQQQTSSQQPSVPQQGRRPIGNFFKKVPFVNRDGKSTAVPQGYQPNVAPTPPAIQFSQTRPVEYPPTKPRTTQSTNYAPSAPVVPAPAPATSAPVQFRPTTSANPVAPTTLKTHERPLPVQSMTTS